MKLLVTGGAGFIGTNFIRYWLKNHPQDKVINLDKLTYAGDRRNLADLESASSYCFVEGDIGDPKLVEKLMEKVEVVVNFAAESHVIAQLKTPKCF